MNITPAERLARWSIGKPFRPPLLRIRDALLLPKRLRHPELREIYVEDDRISRLLEKTITPGMNCVDVGCHFGSFLHEFVRLSPTGQHTAVEPIPHKAEYLRRRFPGVAVHQLAASDQDGDINIYYDPRHSGFSSLGRNRYNGQRAVALPVMCRRLDDIVPAGRPIGFLKVDVEGAEFHVLRGARRILEESRPIILFECSASLISALGLSADRIFSLLVDEVGYHVYLIKNWLAGGRPLDLAGLERAMTYPFQAFNFVAAPTHVLPDAIFNGTGENAEAIEVRRPVRPAQPVAQERHVSRPDPVGCSESSRPVNPAQAPD